MELTAPLVAPPGSPHGVDAPEGQHVANKGAPQVAPTPRARRPRGATSLSHERMSGAPVMLMLHDGVVLMVIVNIGDGHWW